MSNPLRNPNINYSDGWFFVTMQVAQNKTMFGAIADGRCELNALGEQIGFNPAYILSAAAVTALISWYTMITLQNRRLTGWVTLLQSGLYLFLFAVLQLKDYALLAGSIGLFIILAVIMYASKQIKWYPEG